MPKIGILSVSAIEDDPRVLRQGDTLSSAGYDVVGFGLHGAKASPPAWSVHAIEGDASLASGTRGPAARLAARIADLGRVVLGTFMDGQAEQAYWSRSPAYVELYELARSHSADLWLANDWNTLPIAARLACEQRSRYVYDTHELATEEYADSLKWRLLHRPFVRATEERWIGDAAAVSCVSDGIARHLERAYGLVSPPFVIRSVPPYQCIAFHPTGETINILYHGLVAPGRSLEALIASVPAWRSEMRLTIRGPAEPSYAQHLHNLARDVGAASRVRIAPPVLVHDLVARAAAHDVGLLVLESSKIHNQFALPNKVFEYLMAGLALCLSDLPELSRLVSTTRAGVLIARARPDAIATAINALDRTRIDELKRSALTAAKRLNWEHESGKLLTIVERALRR